jgi:hypothetical protein
MVKMPHHRQRKYHSSITNKARNRFVLIAVSVITSIGLCLSATRTTIAQEPSTAITAPALTSQVTIPPATSTSTAGTQISLNGRTLAGAWLQQPGTGGQLTTHLSDGALRQFIGVDFLSSNNPDRQPIEWFSSVTQPPILTTRLQGGYRYLDITNFAQTAGWQIQVNGNVLVINTPKAQIKNIRQSQQRATTPNTPFNSARIVLDLDQRVPWQVSQGLPIARTVDPEDEPNLPSNTQPDTEWVVILDGIADPALLQLYAPQPTSPPNALQPRPAKPASLVRKIEIVNNRTLVSLSVPFGMSPQIISLPDPNRLVIDLRPDALVQKDIAWAPGLRWRQQFVNLGTDRFPVVWLDVNSRQVGLTLQPIGTDANSQTGITPLIQMAAQSSAVAAINAGYFNRNNQLPLGAIRRDNQWLSGPILNRGAIAWNNSGQFYIGRLTLQETLNAPNNQKLPILFLNSGYVQSGIARYTPTWGPSYTPLTDNEIILVVQRDRVTNQLPGGKAGEKPVAIPRDGYLLTFRANAAASASQLPIGTTVSINSTTNSAEFNRYPHIMGAGPLLIQNNQIVLDAASEQFTNAFITQRAIRSGICTTANNSVILATVHNRAGGLGPSLAEHAQIMNRLGCVNALNLDGGSSTSLYLGGQLLNRSPNTAARVHNGIGIFLQRR